MASNNGQVVVIGRQSAFFTSQNGGQTFPFSGGIPFGDGDPSLAIGRSGNIYYSGIDNCATTTVGCNSCPANHDCDSIARSTNNGQTFPYLGVAVDCPRTGVGNCFPDQEHIAADRVTFAPGNLDQVYMTWRNFPGGVASIVCSQNSGVNWTAPVVVEATGQFPRITVGQDGFVYVAYWIGANYRLAKYTSCTAGLAMVAGFPVTVATRTPVFCPFPGHDRCDQNPSSQMVAVDDTNPNHVYYAFAQNTVAANAPTGNDNIILRDSLDGGLNWPAARSVIINNIVPGNRIMPWICTTFGDAYMTWYDRRAAGTTAAQPNDLTQYFAGGGGLDGLGNLVKKVEFQVSEPDDNWCASGWPCGTRAKVDSESCTIQPQLAGFCCLGGAGTCFPGTGYDGSSGNRCDFSDVPVAGTAPCLAGESCVTAGGCPKYGDYNGNACAAGRLFAAWASATGPLPGAAAGGAASPQDDPDDDGGPGVPLGNIGILFDRFLVAAVGQIQVPGGVNFGNVCVGATGRQTLNVCNTGNANLHVTSITSNNTQFTVTTPTGGFPVTISPDFCFPFQVNFTPTSQGLKTGTLTINSDDPALPATTVAVSGTGGVPLIQVSPNPLNFGNVPTDATGGQQDFKDKNFQIHNQGTCDLVVTSVTPVAGNTADFTVLPTAPPLPVTLSPDATIVVVIEFNPTAPGTRTATLRTVSNSGNVTTNTDTTLTGVGTLPGISADPTTLNFGNVPTNPVGGELGTKDATFNVCNGGQSNLSVTGITIGGTNPGDFTLNTVVPGFPITITPDSCHPFTITFNPAAAGPRTATAQVAHNATNTASPLIVNLAGIGTIPVGEVSPNPLNFGLVPLTPAGQEDGFKDLVITVRNKGNSNLVINSITFSGVNAADFKLLTPAGTFPTFIAPGSQFDFTIEFNPTPPLGNPNRTATIRVNTNDPRNLGSGVGNIDITATGVAAVPDIKTNPATRLALGSARINRSGPCKDIDILNTGASNLAITSVTITNDPNGWFGLCGDVPASLADPLILSHDAHKTIQVQCHPRTRDIVQIAFLTITSNDPDQPQRQVRLRCRLANDP